MAVDALSEIAIRHPATSEQILDIYRHYMTRPNTEARMLNGLLIGRLLDLKAGEAIEEIRLLFAQDCVDITCAGDLEEVEIELGFRTQRSTPKPSYAQLHGFDMPFAKLARKLGDKTPGYGEDNMFGVIEHSPLRYGSEESVLSISELDGFFAALACAPTTIMPSTWMPAIWGGERLMPNWENEEAIRQFSNSLIQHYNVVMRGFLEQEYEPLFLESSSTNPDLLLVDDWCEGFLRGVELWGFLAPADIGLVETCLLPNRCFCTDEGRYALSAMPVSDIQKLQETIQPNVALLHAIFSSG